jgi:hypothetical protein
LIRKEITGKIKVIGLELKSGIINNFETAQVLWEQCFTTLKEHPWLLTEPPKAHSQQFDFVQFDHQIKVKINFIISCRIFF